jgi:hypothetical protein
MNATQKPQRTFLAVTLLTVIAVTTVFLVYAAILATYTGLIVIVREPGGEIQYNLSNSSNSTWGTTLDITNGTAWYAKITFTSPSTQTVTIEWTLLKGGSTTGNAFNTTNWALSPTNNIVYSATTGKFANLYNWGDHTKDAGSAGNYQIQVKVYA